MVRGMFRNREEAGQELGKRLLLWRSQDPIVLALPRGGVPVGCQVARALGAPLDVWVVRKVGVPWSPEIDVGSVAESGWAYLSADTVRLVGMTDDAVSTVMYFCLREIAKQIAQIRHGRCAHEVRDRTVILVDDGIATGATIRAAIWSLRIRRPRHIVVATPAATWEALDSVVDEVDHAEVLRTSARTVPVDHWYRDSPEIDDAQIIHALDNARRTDDLRVRLGAR